MKGFLVVPISVLGIVISIPSQAQEENELWNAKFQATYISQEKKAFSVPYTGSHSLIPEREVSYSYTMTGAVGARLWQGAEAYLNIEAAQGKPLSNLTGFGGFSNGEMARTSGAELTVYRARLFARQTWALGGGHDYVESEANQLAGTIDKRRIVLTLGNFSVQDIFDDNAYSHDPRTQFLNWSLMTHGAYDFAGDARGYTRGMAIEGYYDDWAVRFGRFIQPHIPNQQKLDSRIFSHYGDQIELEHQHFLADQVGKLRFLVFRNKVPMSRYDDALVQAAGGIPDVNAVRYGNQIKQGVGLNIEQAITENIGVFSRLSHADGKTEVYAFTEMDDSQSLGFLAKGSCWQRSQDTVGFALARNGISKSHREYLAAGGLGFFIGDGQLNYRPEIVTEAFYNMSLYHHIGVSLDWQHINNPAYNADRGSVNVGAIRLHVEL